MTKLGKVKKAKEYIPEALQQLATFLVQVRPQREGGINLPTIRVNISGLQEAIKSLPKAQREIIEKFWGLTGGTNHSKKINSFEKKDIAFINSYKSALLSLRLLYKLDYLILYDDNLHLILDMLDAKINQNGVEDIGQLERIKYLIAFFLFVENGPKMFGEDDLLKINTKTDVNAYFDEYAMLKDLVNMLNSQPENSINILLLRKMFDMFDIKNEVLIKKSLGIEISKGDEPEEAKTLQSFSEIRSFKESIFEYGAWNVTQDLILGKFVDLDCFMKDAHKIIRKWRKIQEFKTDEMELRTSEELRLLDIYTVGGLRFTDSYEVGFLYVERGYIEKLLNC